ncbi:MAG: SufD family Fe-S cluster assembly protein [Pseudomonadota bacterium]
MDLGVVLAAPGARSEMPGFALGEGAQHLDHHTVHAHTAPDTWSNLEFKTVLADQSRSTYTGRIRITPVAPRSAAFQGDRKVGVERAWPSDDPTHLFARQLLAVVT